jgi:hypothetical protein
MVQANQVSLWSESTYRGMPMTRTRALFTYSSRRMAGMVGAAVLGCKAASFMRSPDLKHGLGAR